MVDESKTNNETETPDSKVLNQEEIDSLLGYGSFSEEDVPQKNAVHAILNSNMVSYERLPMLEIVFDRLIRLMATFLRIFIQDKVEIYID